MAIGYPQDEVRQMGTSMQEQRTSRKEKAVSFLNLASSGQVAQAYGGAYLADDFRHHNPRFPGETDALARAMKQNAEEHPDGVYEIQRALEDGDLVAVHARTRLDPGEPELAAVHIFRFENGRIAELWDVVAPVPEDSPNENGAF
jgi:predicted SnoaL-like aldol condensation-catalyzing enzyme